MCPPPPSSRSGRVLCRGAAGRPRLADAAALLRAALAVLAGAGAVGGPDPGGLPRAAVGSAVAGDRAVNEGRAVDFVQQPPVAPVLEGLIPVGGFPFI